MTEWVNKKCSTCGKDFFVKPDWLNPPEACDFCRAKMVGDIVQKLKNYLHNRKKYDSKPIFSSTDKEAMRKDIALRVKIEKIFSKAILDHDELIPELLEDKEIRKLIIKLGKEHKINNNSRNRHVQQKTGKMAVISNVSLFQGGSPGLGKKA
jgi:hypothetical protein